MVTSAEPDASRWDRSWPALPYLFILLPTVFSVLQEWQPEAAVLAAFTAAWHWFMVSSRFSRIDRPAVAVGYFVVMLALVAALIRIDSLFTVAGLGAFVQSFTLLSGRLAYVGVAATAAVLVLARPEPRPAAELAFSFLLAVLVASTVGLFIQTISRQNQQRKAMIAQLKASGAKMAALAEENSNLQSQLLTRAREAGVLSERQRMAREIHDTIAQGLTAILTQLEVAENVIDDVPAARSRLDTVRMLARESLNEARRSVLAMRPAPLADAQLATALEEVANTWSQTAGIPAPVSVTGEARPLHAEVEMTILRVAQEALANVAKHADAGRVAVTLSYMEDVVVLDVRDDGRGFDPQAVEPSPAGGFGLVSMRQRVTRLAGDFEIESAPDQGTGVSATVPAIPADSRNA
ncbi:sensor histidine kinase [Nonomuraea soli]|uniref:Signal transduction histidine kinase n=1 Tax=Nonomuraea soli TaxID=1032476 RepID=A0A7W0HSD4_9ACTN|nr:sensor histidine kinase [Nonomuraea soli]MBA2893782.1 signal transduction histidine kinase [Nonomuraea soli]